MGDSVFFSIASRAAAIQRESERADRALRKGDVDQAAKILGEIAWQLDELSRQVREIRDEACGEHSANLIAIRNRFQSPLPLFPSSARPPGCTDQHRGD